MTLPLKHILDKMNSICAMPEKFELELIHSIERIEIPKNHVLVRPGQICDYYYYIEKGILSCHIYDDTERKESSPWIMFEGNIATSIKSFNDRTPATETLRAAKHCTLHLLHWEDVDRYTRESREFAYIRQSLTNKYYILISEISAQRLNPPEQRFLYLKTLYGDNFDRVPARLMASHIGISETTFYEIKRNFGGKNGKLRI